MITLSPLQMDALREIGTIGTGHAALGLSVLLKNKVEISVPKAQAIALQQVANFLGGAEQVVCAICLELKGEIHGAVIMMFPQDSATSLVNLLIGQEASTIREFNEYEESALKELGNIATGSYLNALANLTGYKVSCSPPSLAVDMLGAVLNQILTLVAEEIDQAILIATNLAIDKCLATGYFLLLPDIASLNKILERLRI